MSRDESRSASGTPNAAIEPERVPVPDRLVQARTPSVVEREHLHEERPRDEQRDEPRQRVREPPALDEQPQREKRQIDEHAVEEVPRAVGRRRPENRRSAPERERPEEREADGARARRAPAAAAAPRATRRARTPRRRPPRRRPRRTAPPRGREPPRSGSRGRRAPHCRRCARGDATSADCRLQSHYFGITPGSPRAGTLVLIGPRPYPSMLKRLTLLTILLAGLVALVPGTASAATCWKELVNDYWADNRVDSSYPISCYREAMEKLPRDVQEYSDAQDDLRRALLLAIRDERDSGGSEFDEGDQSAVPPTVRGRRRGPQGLLLRGARQARPEERRLDPRAPPGARLDRAPPHGRSRRELSRPVPPGPPPGRPRPPPVGLRSPRGFRPSSTPTLLGPAARGDHAHRS